MRRRSSARRDVALWGVMAIALAVRLPMLGRSFIGDEICTITYARQPLPDLFAYVAAHDSHPPLYYLLIHFWRMLGTSEIWTRIPGVIFGSITCCFVYLLALEFSSRRFALVSALFASISPVFTTCAQLARNYVLVTFLIALSTCLFVGIIRRPKLSLWLGYVLASAAALYTFYYASYAIVAQNLAFAISGRHSRRKWLGWLAAQMAILVLFLPWMPSFLQQFHTVRSDPTSIDTAFFGGDLARSVVSTIVSVEPLEVLPVRLTTGAMFPVFAGLLGLGVVVGCAYAYRRRGARGWAVMATLLLASLGLALALRIVLNGYIAPNYLAFASVFGCVLAGMALGRAKPRTAVGVAVVICLLELLRLPGVYKPIDDWRAVGELLSKRVEPGEYVATLYSGAADCVDYYTSGRIKAHGLPDGVPGVEPTSSRDLVCAVRAEHIPLIGGEFALHEDVWMVWYHIRRGKIDRGSSLVRNCLRGRGFSVVESYTIRSVKVEHYVSSATLRGRTARRGDRALRGRDGIRRRMCVGG